MGEPIEVHLKSYAWLKFNAAGSITAMANS